MGSSRWRLVVAILPVALVGCGPLHMPMPPRLDPDDQATIDDSWNRAARDAPAIDRQRLLDTLMRSQAYQVGVDRLSMRSEKHCEAGLVVMEIHADRATPESDAFTFTLYDRTGRIVRSEQYRRADVEQTYKELFIELGELEYRAQGGILKAPEQQRREALAARVERAGAYFPELDEHGKVKARD